MTRALPIAAIAGCFDPSYSDLTECGAGDTCPPGRSCVARPVYCVER